MDLLKLLKTKAEYFTSSEDDSGVLNIISHIEIAERHYSLGKLGDDYLYNDVIYRSNQAFEGSLKEAYRIIAGKDGNNITPYKIEQYLEKNDILKERVLQLFTNYRTEWRNKSTHDYKLYFSEQEAFLAIVNISAFINILLDQMIEKRAYVAESKLLEDKSINLKSMTENTGLLERTIEMLKLFSLNIPEKYEKDTIHQIREVEIMGSLNAFLNKINPEIQVFQEYSIIDKDTKSRRIADFLLMSKNEKLIIEIKNPIRRHSRILSNGVEQVLNYLLYSGVSQGILFIPPVNKEKLELVPLVKKIGNKEFRIIQIFPKNLVKSE